MSLYLSLSVCGGGALSEPLLERVMQQLLTTLGDRAANASQVRIAVLRCAVIAVWVWVWVWVWGGWWVMKGSVADISAQIFCAQSQIF